MPAATVLVIDDEADIRQALRVILTRAGYTVIEAANGREGLRLFHVNRPSLTVLDVAMPEMDGWEVLERLRDLDDSPVMMLTARGLEADKVRGLKAGADDYLTKPFGNQELLARIEALLRRAREPKPTVEIYDDGLLVVDVTNRTVTQGGEAVQLTPTEFRLLAALVTHPRQLLSADQLLRLAWRDETEVGPERVKFTMYRLRKKLGWKGSAPVEAVRGFGYRFTPPGE